MGLVAAAAALAALAWCGGGGYSSGGGVTQQSDGGTSAYVVTIQGYAFSPQNLNVPAGATVTVKNGDGFAHSATSSTTPTAYTPGAVGGVSFDTGLFTGTQSFTIPATAVAGTVVPYYCKSHTSMMLNQPTITIAAP